jgi:hypothetical protein
MVAVLDSSATLLRPHRPLIMAHKRRTKTKTSRSSSPTWSGNWRRWRYEDRRARVVSDVAAAPAADNAEEDAYENNGENCDYDVDEGVPSQEASEHGDTSNALGRDAGSEHGRSVHGSYDVE